MTQDDPVAFSPSAAPDAGGFSLGHSRPDLLGSPQHSSGAQAHTSPPGAAMSPSCSAKCPATESLLPPLPPAPWLLHPILHPPHEPTHLPAAYLVLTTY